MSPFAGWAMTDGLAGASSSSSSPSSPFTSSSSSSLALFSPGQSSSSSLENLDAFGDDEDSAIFASFLANDTGEDVYPMPAREEKRRRREACDDRNRSSVADIVDRRQQSMFAPHTDGTAGCGEAGAGSKRKASAQNVANDWLGTTDSAESAFYTGSSSSLPLQLFGATSSFCLSPSSASTALSSLPSLDYSSLPSPSSPLDHINLSSPPQQFTYDSPSAHDRPSLSLDERSGHLGGEGTNQGQYGYPSLDTGDRRGHSREASS
jgi:hypothetical protein